MRAGLSKDEAQKQERMRAERAAKKEAKIQVRDKIALALHLHCPYCFNQCAEAECWRRDKVDLLEGAEGGGSEQVVPIP
jgi:hypothetical protein